jgi:hypothetical protein
MVAVLEAPCVIPPRNSNSNSSVQNEICESINATRQPFLTSTQLTISAAVIIIL